MVEALGKQPPPPLATPKKSHSAEGNYKLQTCIKMQCRKQKYHSDMSIHILLRNMKFNADVPLALCHL